MMKSVFRPVWIAWVALLIMTISCRPVLTIGWSEIGILAILILILLGPALFGLYKKIDKFRSWNKNKTEEGDTE